MKFLHVSTGDVRGAFSGAWRLHRNLIAEGHESRMVVGDRQGDDPTVLAPSPRRQAFGRLLTRAANQFLKRLCGRERQVAHHLSFAVDLVKPQALARLVDGFRPDLVIVYYTSGFLSPQGLRRLQEALGAPVALYLMDMEMLTGGCHYAWQCRGYTANCGDCPVPPRWSGMRRMIARQWRQRRASLETIRPVVVGGTGWLMRQMAESTITRDLPHRQIMMGIDAQRYAPGDKAGLRQRFGLPASGTVLYFGAQNLDDPRKGFVHLRAALERLGALLSPQERATIVLFTVGRLDEARLAGLPFAHVHHGYISEPSLFAATYAAADLFICPSVEDSGPMMINEAVMSGTPVAAFEMGVAVDLVLDGLTGFRVPLADAGALAQALASFVLMPPAAREAMSGRCRALGLSRTSAAGQVEAFVQLAKDLQAAAAASL